MKLSSSKLRIWLRTIHRDLSFFFSGMILIYAISGLVMNHRDSINPHYSVSLTHHVVKDLPEQADFNKDAVLQLMETVGVEENYTKHYFPRPGHLKVFLKGGSSLEADIQTGKVAYESLTRRTLISTMTTLHYNPGRWWTWFADAFAVSLLIITLSGLFMIKGPKGMWGRGGIEFALGILLPIILLLFVK